MIVFSFAWRKQGHSPCNVRLAEADRKIIRLLGDEKVVVVAQRTVASVLKEMGIEVTPVPKGVGYEGSEAVVEYAAKIFRAKGITEVIPIAQPFLQLWKCHQLVRKAGFQTWSYWKLDGAIGWIGFDPESVQPWTRGPVRTFVYAIRQMFFGFRLPPELSEP